MPEGNRKLIAWAVVAVITAVATAMKIDVPPNAKELLVYASGFFFAGNGVEHLAKAYSSKNGK